MNSTTLLITILVLVGGVVAYQALTAEPGPAFEIKPGVEVPAAVLPKLTDLAEKYRAATGQTLVITDGTRRPEAQAALMIRNLERGDNLLDLYANKPAVTEIQLAWETAVKSQQTPAMILQRVTNVIAEQVAAKNYVSQHLREGAVDVRSSDMTEASRTAFKAAAKELGIAVVDETKTVTPHYHLNFL